MQARHPHAAVGRDGYAVGQRHAGREPVHRQPVGQRHAPAHQLEDGLDQRHRQALAQAARRQVVKREAAGAALEHRHLVGQREREPDAVLRVDADGVRVEAAADVVQREGAAGRVELHQALLRRGRDEDVAVALALRQRVRVRGAVVAREFLQARRQQAARRLALAVRDLVHGHAVGGRVDLPHAILDVVGHVDMAVAAEQLVVLLAHRVADRPLGERAAGQRGVPVCGSGHALGMLAQRAPARREQLGQRLLVGRRQARAVAHHALDEGAPLVGAALGAGLRIALLVAEAALQLEVALALAITEIECTQPGVGRQRLGALRRIGLALQRHAGFGLARREFDARFAPAGLAHQQAHGAAAIVETHAAGGVGEASDVGLDHEGLRRQRVAAVAGVGRRARGRHLAHHRGGERRAAFVDDAERGGTGRRGSQHHQQGREQASTHAGLRGVRSNCAPWRRSIWRS